MSASVFRVRNGLRSLALNFFCTSPYVLTSWMTCTHTRSPINDISKMIMITQEQRVERERGEKCASADHRGGGSKGSFQMHVL